MITLHSLLKRIWHRSARLWGAQNARLWIPIETAGDPQRLAPGTLTYQDFGTVQVVRREVSQDAGTPPFGLSQNDDCAVLSLRQIPLRAHLAFIDGRFEVLAQTQPGPRDLIFEYRCRRVVLPVEGGAP